MGLVLLITAAINNYASHQGKKSRYCWLINNDIEVIYVTG